jgi:hypothetical protein
MEWLVSLVTRLTLNNIYVTAPECVQHGISSGKNMAQTRIVLLRINPTARQDKAMHNVKYL